MRWFAELAIGAANFEGDPGEAGDRRRGQPGGERDASRRCSSGWRASPTTRCSRPCSTREVDGERLTREEIQSNLKVMIVGGLQATTDLIALSLGRSCRIPTRLDEVRADPALIDPAIEEAARWHSPVGTSTRQTTRDDRARGRRRSSRAR